MIDEAVYRQTLLEFPPHPIRSDEENEKAIAMLEALVSPSGLTIEQKAVAEVLVTLIESYEQKRHAIESTSPLESLMFLMEANGLKQRDLVPSIASSGVISEILAGQRSISKGIAKKLGERFHVPHTVFL
jgi:HTH-type transcriptional regulator/antitoxin HigA